jgi:hypothetical protein
MILILWDLPGRSLGNEVVVGMHGGKIKFQRTALGMPVAPIVPDIIGMP